MKFGHQRYNAMVIREGEGPNNGGLLRDCETLNIAMDRFQLYCQDTADTPPPSQSSSVSSPDPESGLWYCVCGNTVTGQYCSWCGYGN